VGHHPRAGRRPGQDLAHPEQAPRLPPEGRTAHTKPGLAADSPEPNDWPVGHHEEELTTRLVASADAGLPEPAGAGTSYADRGALTAEAGRKRFLPRGTPVDAVARKACR